MAGLSQAQRSLAAFGSMASGIAGAASAALGGLSVVGAGRWALGLATSLQQTQQQFGILIGDATKAQAVLAQLREFDITSPLGLGPLLEGTKTLLQFGVASDQAVGTAKMLADVSMGNSERFRLLALAMAQVTSAGRLQGQDLLQLINSGWNPLDQIAKRTGETMAQVKDRMSKGAVSAREVQQALVDATSAGGRFAGMIDAASATVGGRFDQLKGRVEALATSVGERMLPAAMSFVRAAESMLSVVDSLSGSSTLAAVQVAAFAGSFLLTVNYASRIVAAIRSIITVIRAMTTAQVIFQSLAGPKGWATIAAGLVVAAGSVAALEFAFAGVEEQATAAAAASKKVSDEAAKSGAAKSIDAAAAASKALTDQLSQAADKFGAANAGAEHHAELLQRGQQIAEQYQPPEATFAATVDELRQLVAAGAITGDTFDRAFTDAANKLTQAKVEAQGLTAAIDSLGAAVVGTSQGFAAFAQARANAARIDAQTQAAAAAQQQAQVIAQGVGVGVGPVPAQMTLPQLSAGGPVAELLDMLGESRRTNQLLGELVTEAKREKKPIEVAGVELY